MDENVLENIAIFKKIKVAINIFGCVGNTTIRTCFATVGDDRE